MPRPCGPENMKCAFGPLAAFRRLELSDKVLLGGILASTAAVAGIIYLIAPKLLPSGLLAYTLGLRHAVDADHIAAIDNVQEPLSVTRRLIDRGCKTTARCGFFFALGHSSVVVILCFVIVIAGSAAEEKLDSASGIGALLGPLISSSFLLISGVMNAVSAFRIWRAWRQGLQESSHSHAVQGLLLRCCPRLFELVTRPWHMYFVGLFFGLGFDTATQIGLLGLVSVSGGLSDRGFIMLLPLCFMAGMCLVDSLNGILMTWIYLKALVDSRGRLYFSFFLTATTAFTALLVGSVVMLGAIGDAERLEGPFWEDIGVLNDHFEVLGLVVILLFLCSAATAMGCFRFFKEKRPTCPHEDAVLLMEERLRTELRRYIEEGNFIDRSGV